MNKIRSPGAFARALNLLTFPVTASLLFVAAMAFGASCSALQGWVVTIMK